MNNRDLIKAVREFSPDQIANQLVSVQPIDPRIIQDLRDNASSEHELREEGYEPVSRLGLMWVKK